jgi:predicted nucleotidyltransferase
MLQLPPIEKLLDRDLATASWPEYQRRPGFADQLDAQRTVLESFRTAMQKLPDGISPTAAVSAGQIAEATAIALYRDLTEYLMREPAHGRLALFLPFELLAPAPAGTSAALADTVLQFQRAYRTAWEAQLTEHEVRANFTDGDVLEAELRDGDHPRVVKATHLIPGLIAADHLSVAEAEAYGARATDLYLRAGIQDALAAYDQSVKPIAPVGSQRFSFGEIADNLRAALGRIESDVLTESTPARTAWLKLDARERAIDHAAGFVAKHLTLGAQLPEPIGLDAPLLEAYVDGLRRAALQIPRIYERHQAWLDTVRTCSADTAPTDVIVKLHAHLHAVGTIGDEQLQEWDITLPNLRGPLSANLAPLSDFLTEVEEMSAAIADHPYLRDRIHPVTLVFGSQLKGYGKVGADADIAVFVQPGVARSERARLEAELAHVFDHEKIEGKVVMFWLEERADELAVIDWPDFALSDGESSWIHVLFGAAWVGNPERIRHLERTLLSRYFHDPGTLLHGKPTRERWLEEMERDTVLYRLLHKGYERFYPIESPHAGIKTIDGDSAFYDPRFRRIATELYLSRVFLPLVS